LLRENLSLRSRFSLLGHLPRYATCGWSNRIAKDRYNQGREFATDDQDQRKWDHTLHITGRSPNQLESPAAELCFRRLSGQGFIEFGAARRRDGEVCGEAELAAQWKRRAVIVIHIFQASFVESQVGAADSDKAL
jgi:hypothetical protein